MKQWNVRSSVVAVVLLVMIVGSTVASTSNRIPIIDIGSWTLEQPTGGVNNDDLLLLERRTQVVDSIRMACEDVGFFGIINSGFNDTLLQETFHVAKQFFDLSMDYKSRYISTNATQYPYGYEYSSEKLDQDQTVDPKESFSIGPISSQRQYPSQPTQLAAVLHDYYQGMEQLANVLLEIFAYALQLQQQQQQQQQEPQQSSRWFDDKMDQHLSALRILNYFPISTQSQQSQQQLPKIRAGAHTDYGPLTILKPDSPGLQVQVPKKLQQQSNSSSFDNAAEYEWIDVPFLPNVLIINLGDMMQRWTNDKWKSTLHRVVAVPDSDTTNDRRQSIAYFVNTNGDTIITPLETCCVDEQHPPKYKPITAKEHILSRHLASMGITTAESTTETSIANDEL